MKYFVYLLSILSLMTVIITVTESTTEPMFTIGESVDLNEKNFEDHINTYNLVFVNFYTKWCYYSKKLLPEFDQTSRILSEKFPKFEVLLGKVDCDAEKSLAKRYKISSYPYLLLFVKGEPLDQKYIGQRTVADMVKYVDQHYWTANSKISSDFIRNNNKTVY